MSDTLRIFLLGSPQIYLGEKAVTGWSSRAAEAVIIYVALADAPIPRSKLVDLIWPDSDPKQAQANLRSTLSKIRKLLGRYIDISRHTIGTRPDATIWIDSVELRRLVTPNATLAQLAEAVELYRDSFLSGFELRGGYPFEEWQFVQRERLERQAVSALRRLAHSHLEAGSYALGERYAARWIELDQYGEDAVRTMLWLQLRQGRRNEALQQYAAFEKQLVDELGVQPVETTQAVAARARRVTQLGANNLRPARTPFVGREQELADLAAHLGQPTARLTTLLGMGGMGKTRLAHALTSRILQERPGLFLDGVWFVELATVTSAETVIRSIAGAVGLRLKESKLAETLQNYLQSRELLLVLDNVEQLVDDPESLDVIADLLQAAPDLKIVVTSRERLHLYEETVVDLSGLDEAAALFVNRAQRQKAIDWEVHSAEISKICTLLDGVPLAIELAAGWTRERSLADITASITQSFDFLATRYRNVPDRHRSVRAAFRTSWERLDAATQQHFAALSVFSGGFSAEAAQQVAGVPARILRQLVDRSLLAYLSDTDRYALHELLRDYAAEQLESANTLHEQHAHYYLNQLVELEYQHLTTGEDHLQPDLNNVRNAWRWAHEQAAVDLMYPSLVPLARYWETYNLTREALQLLESAEAHEPTNHHWQGRLKTQIGFLYRVVSQYDQSLAMLEAALTALPEDALHDRADAHLWSAMCYVWTDQAARGKEAIDQAVALYRQLGNQKLEALALSQTYTAYSLMGEDEAALSALSAALVLGSYPRYQAETIKYSGFEAISNGAYTVAIGRFEEVCELADQLNDVDNRISATVNMALAYSFLGDLPRTVELAEQALAHFRQFDKPYGLASGNVAIAGAAYRSGDPARALRHYHECMAIYEQVGNANMVANIGAHVAMCEAHLGRESARSSLKKVIDGLVATDNTFFRITTTPVIATALAALGEQATALRLAVYSAQWPSCEDSTRQFAHMLIEQATAEQLADVKKLPELSVDEAYQLLQKIV